jgi:hypothetical protein
MRTIWKYPCYTEPFDLIMPKDAEVVAFDDQGGRPSFWVIVDTDQPQQEQRHFMMIGTGHPAPAADEGRYLGTCKQLDGVLMWHLFELGAAP